MTGIVRDNISYFVFSCYYREVFMYVALHGKLYESLRITLDDNSNSTLLVTIDKEMHGIVFDSADADKYECLIAYGDGFARKLKLKYE